MAEEPPKRRLAAILAADVAGYSRLMGEDEAGTLSALKARRKEILQPVVSKHHGRIVKLMGDGVLVEFASAVNAVVCAVELQGAMAAANKDLPEDRQISLRVGINLGDVMVEDGDLYGDGVNIAARLEALAEPGCVFVSSKVRDEVVGKLGIGFEDLGPQSLKNIAEPVRAYRVSGVPAVAVAAPKNATDKPSIAVIPFVNMSGDPEQEYFSDGITDDIITALSRFRSLFVIARHSSFQLRDKAIGIVEAARRLGARYIVEGSLRKQDGRVRINVQLVDAAANSNLWSDCYDRELKDVFAIQDEVTSNIVSRLVGRLESAELTRARHRPTENLQVYECLHRASSLMGATGDRENETVQALLLRAISLDPHCARAHAELALTYVFDWLRSDALKDLDKAFDAARAALTADDQDSWCHLAFGFACMHRRLFQQAQEHYELALALNPNDSEVIANMGELLSYRGKPEEAIDWIKQAMRLNPLHPAYYWNDLAGAYYHCHRYGDAIAARLRMLQPFYAHDICLAACYGQLGDTVHAKQHADIVLKNIPNFSARAFVAGEPFEREVDELHLLEGLHKAGLPD
jgi:adenylate cyclase